MSIAIHPSFSRFGWLLARSLRVLGKVYARLIIGPAPKTASVQVLFDRVIHLNAVLGYFIPPLTYVLSQKILEDNHVVFRPFTDDSDKVSENYEFIVHKLLSPRHSEVIIDVGANIGVHTVWLSRKVGPEGIILAVEPERSNFTVLELNLEINNLPNVIPIRLALGGKRARGQLVIPSPSVMGQATTITSTPFPKPLLVNIDFETLDNVTLALGLSEVAAIKIDVEGAEVDVIRGAAQTISRFRPMLVIEAHGHPNLSSLKHLLESMHMTIVSVTQSSSRPNETRWFVFANYYS
jgi:FkbM family methyltransferase